MLNTNAHNVLDSFLQKLHNKEVESLKHEILRRFVQEGETFAKSKYAGYADITITTEINGNSAVIAANGEQVGYIEFGTGTRGEGSYYGKLPTQPITFYSKVLQRQVSLGEWTYAYASKEGGRVWIGWLAGGQMWSTAQWLRSHAFDIIHSVTDRKN